MWSCENPWGVEPVNKKVRAQLVCEAFSVSLGIAVV